jgi:N-glycosylase/DNA lyase
MIDSLDAVFAKFREAEANLLRELQRKRQEFYYEVRKGKIHFTDAARARHKNFLKRLVRFLRDSNIPVLLTTPIIWLCLVPVVLLDVVITIYQMICFPIYGIPKVRRSDFILLDRHRLAYLNLIEKLNCQYCAYANGIFAYATEIAARTEQYWCPIKHALRMKGVHSRYQHFFDYGDAEGYRRGIEQVRRDFADLEQK